MKHLLALTTLLGSMFIAAEAAQAQQNGDAPTQYLQADPSNPWATGGHFSWRLGARFDLQPMRIPGHEFTAARIVTHPVAGSPLRQLGLRRGDVITRLDGRRVLSYQELENHHLYTTVRYIRQGTSTPGRRNDADSPLPRLRRASRPRSGRRESAESLTLPCSMTA